MAVLVAAALTATAWALRYADARSLRNDGGLYGWEPPDGVRSHSIRLGEYSGSIAPWRPGARQSFVFDVSNVSPVTQTILGLSDVTGMHESVAVSVPGDTAGGARYERSWPVSIAPHDTRLLRFTFTTPPCGAGGAMSWDGIALRVRVGWFTRVEHVHIENVFEIKTSAKTC